jgi:histidinol dehydrogenase
MKTIPLILILCLTSLTSLTGCSSEDREAITDKEAQKQVDRIRKPIEDAKQAVKRINKYHQEQQQQHLPD